MNQIYLVCTRSAISASALTYIINQSPQFYNVVHNNLWLDEAGSEFTNATVIEDWWNIPNSFARVYNHDVRNNETMRLSTLQNLCNSWDTLSTGKDIALFTHATNTQDIMNWRDEWDLPVKVVTTIMGNNCYNYMDLFLKREYSDEMNKFVSLTDTWKYVQSQFSSNDVTWAKHADFVVEMHNWLGDPLDTYVSLGIASNQNMNTWVAEYKMKNNHEEWDINRAGIADKLKTLSYIYQHYHNTFNTDPGKKLFSLAILNSVRFNDEDITDVQQVIDKTQKIIKNQLTIS